MKISQINKLALLVGTSFVLSAHAAGPGMSVPATLDVNVTHGVLVNFGTINAPGARVLLKVKGPAPYADCDIQGFALGMNVQRVSVSGRLMSCNAGAARYAIRGYVVGAVNFTGLPATASIPPTLDAALGASILSAKPGDAKFILTHMAADE
jgi:hypothetical protein